MNKNKHAKNIYTLETCIDHSNNSIHNKKKKNTNISNKNATKHNNNMCKQQQQTK